jgi:hypothetical protein
MQRDDSSFDYPVVRVAEPVRFPAGRGAGNRHADRRGLAALALVRDRAEDGAALPLELSCVSATGAFIASDLLLPIGAEVELEFDLTESERISACGRVVRVEDRGRRPGMGVLFERMAPEARARLRQYTHWQ